MESLSDKLKALGVKLGVDGLPHLEKQNPAGKSIEDLLPEGKVVLTQQGESFSLEEMYPANHLHGKFKVFETADYASLLSLLSLNQEFDLERCVFMDTETTGLAGGAGTLAFMVGLGFYRDNDFWLYQGFLRDPSDEPGMLAFIEELLAGIDTVITYNGKSFDVPLMHSRCVLNGFGKVFEDMRHIDLLHVARKVWKHRLPSRTLGTVENEILGFFRSKEEVPGWMAPELYFDYQKTGDASGVVPVFYHNAMDILTLGVLLRVVAAMVHDPFTVNVAGADLVSIARMYADQNDYDRAIELYEKGIEHHLSNDVYLDALMRFAAIYKRQNETAKALSLWERAVKLGSIEACEELAKFYEHHAKSYEDAMKWVNEGFSCAKKANLSKYQRSRIEDSLQHRLERLLGKWQVGKGNSFRQS
jgi:uncharacterized protein YprB with RNaseH-like and TPR domain